MMNNTNSHNSISYKSSSNNNGRRNTTFGPDGCQVVIDGKRCGETKNLQIIKEFRKLYEDKMRLIDDIAGGDSIQAKVNLQQEWIKDLTDQNEMLVKVVEELEVEAAERVTMLERKLEQSAKCACKVMESYRHFSTNFLGDLQKMDIMQSDLNNLVELVRRAKREGVWNIEGLLFNSININDILRPSAHQLQNGDKNHQSYQKEDVLKERDRRIKELEQQLQPYLDEDSKTQKDSHSLKENYAELQKSLLDMRDALTAEVADKHDTIICLRREVHLLEEQCKKSEQQTHFKDDIIKELRRELKQYKHLQLQDDADMLRFKNSIEGNHLILRHVRQVKKASSDKEDKEVQTMDREKTTSDPQTSALTCSDVPKIQYNKDKYIVDQSALIILLVHKLYVVYRSLRELEARLTFMLTEGNPDGKVMEQAIIDAKNKLAELEDRSLAYLKERDELRLKNDEHLITIETLQKEIAAYKDNLRKSMESLIETQRELVKSKESVNRERERSRESFERSSDKSTNEPDEIESELMRENSELKEIAVALKQESQVLARENSKMKQGLQDLEQQHNSQMDEVHQILINELECLETQHQETLTQLEHLRSELGEAKEAHQLCMEKIQELGHEKPTERDAKARIKYLEDQLRAALMQKEQAVEFERRRRGQEVENLKQTIHQMDVALQNKDVNSANLQSAVDLYANSVNVMEEADERYRTEIAQQRLTIANLQDALVVTKQELEELREKFKQDLKHNCELMRILDMNIRDLESLCLHYYNQFKNIAHTVECLRDENLDLEVARNGLIQDVAMLESRLLKYQQDGKLSEFAVNLKEEMVRLKYENQIDAMKIVSLENDISFYLSQAHGVKSILMKIVGECECEEDCYDSDETEGVITLAQEVERLVDTLQDQIGLAIATLEREQKINQQNANRMDQLQAELEDKEEQIVRQQENCQEIEMKLEAAGVRNSRLEQAVRDLQDMLKGTEVEQQHTEQKVDEGGDVLDVCLSNLNIIKQKVRAQSQAMVQNMDQLKDLRVDYQVQGNTIEMYKRDLESTRARYREEVVELQRVIRELGDKLKSAELRITNITDENKQVQALLSDCQKREKTLQQDLLVKNQDFGNNVKNWKKEETRFMDHIAQLEQQLLDVQNELSGRTVQIDSAKSKLQQISTDASMRYQMGQEELLAAKNEINHLRQVHERLKMENERLQQQVQTLKSQAHQQENINSTVNMQLDKCMCDLKRIEADKYYLEQKNEKLASDLEKVHVALHCKCENVKSLEEELKSLKSNREEIRQESHTVVCNVRAWLEEQKKINDQLKEKLWKKNALIIKYQQEQRPNANSKSGQFGECACNKSGSRMGAIRDPMRQRGGCTNDYFDDDIKPSRRLPFRAAWSLGSRGSDSDSATSSVYDSSADWYDEDTECTITSPCDEPGTQIWIHKVESMTHGLQRSNRYWKKKITDSEFMVSKDT